MKRRQELPIVSGILVAANVIVYLICTFTGNLLYNIGELDAAAVLLHREYGRIIYSMFATAYHHSLQIHSIWQYVVPMLC